MEDGRHSSVLYVCKYFVVSMHSQPCTVAVTAPRSQALWHPLPRVQPDLRFFCSQRETHKHETLHPAFLTNVQRSKTSHFLFFNEYYPISKSRIDQYFDEFALAQFVPLQNNSLTKKIFTFARLWFSNRLEQLPNLKGFMHEKFLAGIFTQIRPVWIGELETRPKTLKN